MVIEIFPIEIIMGPIITTTTTEIAIETRFPIEIQVTIPILIPEEEKIQ